MYFAEPPIYLNQAGNNTKNTSSPSKENKTLFAELPKISHKDYPGKELCTICLKTVGESNEAISCSSCDRWTHRKCTTIKKGKYKKLSQLFTFTWYCKNCQSDEIQNTDILDPKKIDPKNLPDKISIVKKGKNELLVIHLNCRSVVNKEEELWDLINLLSPDIICLTETWLDPSTPVFNVPPGYKLIRKDRSEEFQQKYRITNGGGVAIIYRSYLNIIPKSNLSEKDEEILWAHVQTKNSFLLGVVYRTNYSLSLEEDENGESIMERNIRKATEISNRIVIAGDFNTDVLNPVDKATKDLVKIYEEYSLTQQIKKVTRIDTRTGKASLIDHIWTSPEIKVLSSGTSQGISDHFGTYIKINRLNVNQETKPPLKLFRNYKHYDPHAFDQDIQKELAKSKIESFINEENLDAATEELIKIIADTASNHAPLTLRKTVQSSTYIPWMTKELASEIQIKNELLNDFFVTRDDFLKDQLKDLKNKITSLKFKLKKEWISEQLIKAGNDPLKLWQLYNYLTNRKNSENCIEPDNIDQEKADKFNDYFCKIGKSKNPTPDSDPSEPPENVPTEKLLFKPEKTETIGKLIDKLKLKTATGYDHIDVRLIKDLKKTLSPILVKIINLGYKVKKFPNCLKRATIKPIYKAEDHNQISNYRPIALLPIISKIFERAATDQLMDFLVENNLITKTQHAYLKNHSTVTCLAELINYIHKMLDNRLHTAIVKIDLSKAFDTINHQKLINKLNNLGLHENSLAWITSYLSNRTQKTKFKHFTSSEEPITTGVPQGSILGPLLFICYTNDFASNLDDICKLLSYADDSTFVVTDTSPTNLKNKIKKSIETAQTWFTKNDMRINTDKTEILVFKQTKIAIDMSIPILYNKTRIRLKPKPFVEILGILIDDELTWDKQINRVKKISMNKTRNLHRINKMLPKQSRINMYNTIIAPAFDYCDVIYGGCTERNSKRLQIVQNFAVKSITGNRKHDSATPSFKELNFLKLKQRRKVHESVFIHKALTNNSSANLHQEYAQYVPKANTRNHSSGKLIIPTHNFSKFKKSPLYRTINTWNSIPTSIPKTSIKIHKTRYQNHLIAETHHPSM